MSDNSILFIIGIICLGIGFALGAAVLSFRSSSSGGKEQVAQTNQWKTYARFVTLPGQENVFPEFDGRIIRAPQHLTDMQLKKLSRLNEMLGEWSTGALPNRTRSLKDLAPKAHEEHPIAQEVPAGESSWLSQESRATNQASRNFINPINVVARALKNDVHPSQSPPKSIAGQVDEILQEMLQTSHLAGKGIRLMELPGKGLVVMVGLDQFDGVDAVPDKEIQELIRAAVAEWERRVSEVD